MECDSISFKYFATVLQELEDISSRVKKIERLSDFFSPLISAKSKSLIKCIYFLITKLGPVYDSVDIGVGERMVAKVIAIATGMSVEHIQQRFKDEGDFGVIAYKEREAQKTLTKVKELSVTELFESVKSIATIGGKKANENKIQVLVSIMANCTPIEAKYLVRFLTSNMRIGVSESTIFTALAASIKNHDSSSTNSTVELIKSSYHIYPNFKRIIEVLFHHGIEKIKEYCIISPGIPVSLMLSQPTSVIPAFLSNSTCEYKYDGERAQIHVMDKIDAYIYSRNFQDISNKYLDIIINIDKAYRRNVRNCIIDAEIVAINNVDGKILPFQTLSTRKRKRLETKVSVCVYAFDLLMINGKSLNNMPLVTRREMLHDYFQEVDMEFKFATFKNFKREKNTDVKSVEGEILHFMHSSIKEGCEGIVIKSLDSIYEYGKRSKEWLKLKPDYLDTQKICVDTVDAVVIGAFHGKGKRSGLYGSFLLAIYNEQNETYETICKIGSGISDNDLRYHYDYFSKHTIPNPLSSYIYRNSTEAEVWFEPIKVWEVKCANVTLSPVYKAAIGQAHTTKGISLRFPRYLRERNDKTPTQTTCDELLKAFYK